MVIDAVAVDDVGAVGISECVNDATFVIAKVVMKLLLLLLRWLLLLKMLLIICMVALSCCYLRR